jgi:hypothetical protein
MSQITTTAIGNGTTAYASDIVVKDLDLDVSNRVKDDTPVLNMAMAKKRKVASTLPLWTNDVYRLPATQANQEGMAVSSSMAESNQRANLGNYTQIFSTVISATGSARAVEQSGGDPQAYQEVKQLIELMFDVEAQIVRADQIGTKYGGQSGTAGGISGAAQTGRRFGSLNSFAATHSFNATGGSTSTFITYTNGETTDVATTQSGIIVGGGSGATQGSYLGSTYYVGSDEANTQFYPAIYKQLVTMAEKRFNAKIRTVVCPTSLRTHLSDNMPTSRGINRVNSERGDTIQTYEGDFNYTYQIYDSWIMDQYVANNIYFLNEEVLQWGSLRDLGPNNEIFSNADASLDQFIMEGTLIVRNPAGVAVLHDISASAAAPSLNAYGAGPLRASALVVRLQSWGGSTF